MQTNERKVIEVLLAVLLVVVLVMIVFLFMNFDVSQSRTSSTTSNVNYFNNYNTYTIKTQETSRTIPVYVMPRNSQYEKVYETDCESSYWDYDEYAERKKSEGILGNEIDTYLVHVRNNEYNGNYFTVQFYFEDYYGEVQKRTLTKYISAREKRDFYYKDIYADSFRNYRWSYEVFPQQTELNYCRKLQ